MFEFSEDDIQELIKSIFDGEIDEENLPENLYYAIADRLKEALYKGFGSTLSELKIDTKDYELLGSLRDNVFIFSAAKTYQQTREMTDSLTDDDGTIRSFSDFKKDAREIFDTYNDNYLRAEYNTALASGEMASKWNSIQGQKNILPLLRISVVEDDNTSDICEPLDGITLPVDDPFWSEYYPPNHFNCRSIVEQLAEDEAQGSSEDEVDKATDHADEHMQDEFKMNVGKDGFIFKDDHPYFEVDKKDKGSAQENFGLPIPEED